LLGARKRRMKNECGTKKAILRQMQTFNFSTEKRKRNEEVNV
jgi:hypothetical protein